MTVWTGEQAHQDFVRQGPDARDADIDAAVPGIERLAAHFHVSTDGTRVLNYAEWKSAEHHIAALTAPGEGGRLPVTAVGTRPEVPGHDRRRSEPLHARSQHESGVRGGGGMG